MQFPKTDYWFWKSYKASSWDQSTRLFGLYPLGHTIQNKFSPFCNLKFPPILHTSGLNAKFWHFNNTVVMRKKIPENVIKNLYWWFKSTENFGIFGLVFCLHSCTKKCTDLFSLQAMVILGHKHLFLSVDFISGLIATNFLGLLNHKLVNSKTFSGFFFCQWIPCYWNIKILHSNWKCAKWVEISGCKMDRTCSVGYVLVVNVQKEACFCLSWPLCAIFKICSQISEIAIFKKIIKIPFLQKCQLF